MPIEQKNRLYVPIGERTKACVGGGGALWNSFRIAPIAGPVKRLVSWLRKAVIHRITGPRNRLKSLSARLTARTAYKPEKYYMRGPGPKTLAKGPGAENIILQSKQDTLTEDGTGA